MTSDSFLPTIFTSILACYALLGCATAHKSSESGGTEHSAQLVSKNGAPSVLSQTWFPGEENALSLEFGQPLYSVHNGFFLFEASASRGYLVGSGESTCASNRPDKLFASFSDRMPDLLPKDALSLPLRFQAVISDAPIAGHMSAFVPLDRSLTIRLAFIDREFDCGHWWQELLGTFVHEYVHVYIDLNDIRFPNRLSEEVVAYGIETCSQIHLNGIDELTSTEFDSAIFEHIATDGYAESIAPIVSGESRLSDSLAGKVLADLHFQLIKNMNSSGYEFDDAGRMLDDFCKGLIHSETDFSKGVYLPKPLKEIEHL